MKKVFKVLGFTVIFCLCFVYVYKVLSWKDTMGMVGSSVVQLDHTEDNIIDVAFVGSSHVFAGIHPRTLWNEFGLSTFDMSVSSMDMDSAYYYTKNMLKTQSPKYVFVDLYAITFEKHLSPGNLLRNMLSMPISKNSVDLVTSYFGDDKESAKDYLLRFPIMHTRYKELTFNDFKDMGYAIYGRGERYVLGDGGIIDLTFSSLEEVAELDEKRLNWLNSFKQLSEEENFKLIFCVIPYTVSYTDQQYINSAEQYCKENGIEFVDYNKITDSIGLDLQADSSDAQHLNDKGAEKLSRWIGTYLVYEEGLQTHMGQDGYEMWDQDAAYLDHLYSLNFLAQCYNVGEWQGYFRTINSIPGISYVISLDGNWKEKSQHLIDYMSYLGVSEEEVGDGGVWVKVSGQELQKVAEANDTEVHYIDFDGLTTARIARSEMAEKTEVKVGTALGMNDENGMNIIVYDNVKYEVNATWNIQ